MEKRNASPGGAFLRRRSKSFIVPRSINSKTKEQILDKIALMNNRPSNIQVHIRVTQY